MAEGFGTIDPLSGNAVDGIAQCAKSGLTNLRGLVENPYLQVIDCSGNELTSLEELAALRDLVWLDASDNQLEIPLDFQPPKCQLDGPNWSQGMRWVGSNLEYAKLAHNRIRSIPDISWHVNLRNLDFSHNRISEIADLSCLVNLEVLNISGNQLTSLDAIGCLNQLKALRFHENQIRSLKPCRNFPQLRAVECKSNEVTTLDGLEYCKRLELIDVEGNRITDFAEVSRLQDLLGLAKVMFYNNPIQAESRDLSTYRKRVIYRLFYIDELDNEEVTAKEKLSSENFFGADLEHRKQVFSRYFPNEPFRSVVDPFVDVDLIRHGEIVRIAVVTVEKALERALEHVQSLCLMHSVSSKVANDVVNRAVERCNL